MPGQVQVHHDDVGSCLVGGGDRVLAGGDGSDDLDRQFIEQETQPIQEDGVVVTDQGAHQ